MENSNDVGLILKKELLALCSTNQIKKSPLDVTGSMMGKLQALLPLRKCTVTIFNGLLPNTLTKVLHGEKLGTCITL